MFMPACTTCLWYRNLVGSEKCKACGVWFTHPPRARHVPPPPPGLDADDVVAVIEDEEDGKPEAAPSDGSGPAPPVAKKQRIEKAAKEEKGVKEEQVPPPPPPAVHGKGEDGSNVYRCKVCKRWWDGDGATFCSRCVASKWKPAEAAREKLDTSVAYLVLATEMRRRTHVSVIMAREDVTKSSDALHDEYHDGAVQTGELVCRRCATSHLCPGDELDAKSLPFFRCKGGC